MASYRIHIFFLWVRSVDIALERVADRVKMGGHNVPEDVVRRRYDKGLSNFNSKYRELSDSWAIFDNSTSTPQLIAYFFFWLVIYHLRRYGLEMKKYTKKNLRNMPLAVRAEKAFKEAVADAITEHKRAGVPITIWQNGKVVQIPPDQIEVHEEQTEYEILPKSGR